MPMNDEPEQEDTKISPEEVRNPAVRKDGEEEREEQRVPDELET